MSSIANDLSPERCLQFATRLSTKASKEEILRHLGTLGDVPDDMNSWTRNDLAAFALDLQEQVTARIRADMTEKRHSKKNVQLERHRDSVSDLSSEGHSDDEEESTDSADSSVSSEESSASEASSPGSKKHPKERLPEDLRAMSEFFPLESKTAKELKRAHNLRIDEIRVLLCPQLWLVAVRRSPIQGREIRHPERRVLGTLGLQIKALLEERFPGIHHSDVAMFLDNLLDAVMAVNAALAEDLSWRAMFSSCRARISRWRSLCERLCDQETEKQFGRKVIIDLQRQRTARFRESDLGYGDGDLLRQVIKKSRTEDTSSNKKHDDERLRKCDKCAQTVTGPFKDHNKVCPKKKPRSG